jgi:hypothetical protein
MVWVPICSDGMTTSDRLYAAEQLLAFLKRVGPVEAIWAMTTALEALHDQPASADHLGAASRAFEEAAVEANELAVASPPQDAPADSADAAAGAEPGPLMEELAAE